MRHPLKPTYHALAVIAALLLAACSQPTADAQGVTVSGNAFMRNGVRWVPQGFSLVALVAPPGRELNEAYGRARSLYGPQLFAQAKAFGANTLRLQVSEPGLDPQSSIYDPQYKRQVVKAVHDAEAAGFVVIVSMQWEPPSGLRGLHGMPDETTERAWLQLAGEFKDDGNVMLELFNEPGLWERNPNAWPLWRQGMQGIVDRVRQAGARNVLILDGIHGAHVLDGAPAINDPLNKLAYAVHPYFRPETSNTPDGWQRQWGNFAQRRPVVISEWNEVSGSKSCDPEAPQTSQQLLSFLGERRIGVMVWALDLPNTVVDGAGQPLGFQNFQCGAPGGAATQAAIQYMKSVR